MHPEAVAVMPRTSSALLLSTVRANVAEFKTSDARSGRLAVVTDPRDRAIAARDKQPFVVASRQRVAASAHGGYAERLAGMLTETKRLQLAFWTAFAESLKTSTFDPRKAAAQNWYELGIGTARAKIVLTTLTAHPGRRGGTQRLGCTLAIAHSRSATQQARIVYDHLSRDRASIESALALDNLEWTEPLADQTVFRVYRYRSADIEDRAAWPEAFVWLTDCAERFRDVFAPRIEAIQLFPEAHERG
jgi:hypothetical protein